MKITVNVFQRAKLIHALGNVARVNVAELRQIYKLLDIVEFSDAEKEEIGFVSRNGQWRWELDKSETEYELDIPNDLRATLIKWFRAYNGWSAQDKREWVLDLSDKVDALDEGRS